MAILNVQFFSFSDLCSVDIRTIQRIEAGEVEPRMSTLKILAAALENDELASKSDATDFKNSQLKTTYYISFVAGVFYFFNFILFSLIAQKFSVLSGNGFVLTMSIIHILTGGLFFLGFIVIGKQQQNKLLQISAILIIIMITLFIILDYLARGTGSSVFVYPLRILIGLMGINGILFGASFLKKENQLSTIFMIAGILQIAQNMMFVIPVLPVQYIGLWLAIPANFVLLLIIYCELRKVAGIPSF